MAYNIVGYLMLNYRGHLYNKWWFSEIRGQVRLPPEAAKFTQSLKQIFPLSSGQKIVGIEKKLEKNTVTSNNENKKNKYKKKKNLPGGLWHEMQSAFAWKRWAPWRQNEALGQIFLHCPTGLTAFTWFGENVPHHEIVVDLLKKS